MNRNDHQLDDFFGLKSDTPTPGQGEGIKEVLGKKIGIIAKLRLAPKVLSFRERYIILFFLLVMAGALLSLPITAYRHFTNQAAANGGSFTEGVIGEPRLVNPLLAQTNDTDRDLSSLIYSGLMKYGADGQLVPDLAKSYPEISEDGLNYTVYLKENALWHDGQPVTADDIVFTIQTAQNSDYVSLQNPQHVNWQGVEVDKVNDRTVIFKLKNKYAQFANNLTVGILPKHLWQDVRPINFSLYELNIKPVGSGPYVFQKLKKDKLGQIVSYTLSANEKFYDGRPHIDGMEIRFYGSEDELIGAYNNNAVENIGFISAKDLAKLKFKKRLTVEPLRLPRYFAIFLNQNQSQNLSDKNIRRAVNYATDKQALVQKILDGNGTAVNSPMIGSILGVAGDVKNYDYNLETAKNILASAGWESFNSDGIRVKKAPTPKATPAPKTTTAPKGKSTAKEAEPEKLSIKITTSTLPEFLEIATLLKEQWKAAGIEVTVDALPISQLKQVIKERDYQALLFGVIMNLDADPFSLWHSSQKKDPGQNLALYDNSAADKLLDEARQTLNTSERIQKYNDFQKLVVEDVPAVFLYSPYYLYGHARDIRGFSTKVISMPADRFSGISGWYINTKRIWR